MFACEVAGVEDVSVFSSPKPSEESLIGADSASLGVSLSWTNKTESATDSSKSI